MPKKTEPSAASIALTTSAQSQQDTVMQGIEAFELPKAVVMRLAKSELADYVKVGKDTSLGITKGATVFISYLTAAAYDIAKSRGAKTITGADVLKAMEMIELADQVPLLEEELEANRDGAKKIRASTGAKRKPATPKDGSAYKGKVKTPVTSPARPAGTTGSAASPVSLHPNASTAVMGSEAAVDGPSDARFRSHNQAGTEEGETSEGNDEMWDTEDAEDDPQDGQEEEEEEEEEAVEEAEDE